MNNKLVPLPLTDRLSIQNSTMGPCLLDACTAGAAFHVATLSAYIAVLFVSDEAGVFR